MKLQQGQGFGGRAVRAVWKQGPVLMVAGAIGVLGGCVNLAAPDKPIVIELNINIRQEVVYRLDAEAAKTIEENKDIF
ncbi:YnbE family lipoprotein [Novosphingobium mangrovi (ex Huang et al. 2023)]|uniref:YnbE family lipoprotein n=1 Tax=Novosphingobium mangrovi (ex Huang et al. 2023) TaxID=2976432 RepID=A0ABT2I756_9SPHN|nr:YnbE family lipoprotein [Novosphingobium mangrovi (ex Huang et al. 2023)]MCT2400628.1 YnbE family lipoprotein [Novosphingobium mangrovi (ex Huang et al. 2023)]